MKRKRISSDVISGIYCIENKVNGKKYIGSSKDIYGRWLQHEYQLNKGEHHSRYLQFAWNKYGKDNFKFYILEKCEEDKLFEREQYYYDFYECCGDKGYNVCPIAKTPAHKMTMRDIERGRTKLSVDDIDNIKYYLSETEISIPKVSEIIGVGERTLYRIYYREQYSEIFKDCSFIKREAGKANAKLTDEVIDTIIKMILEGYTNGEISDKLCIPCNSISGIRNGYTWKEKTVNLNLPKSKKNMSKGKKPVNQYDLDGNFIKRWDSGKDIQESIGIDKRQISAACHGQKKVIRGFVWRFEGDPFDKYEISNKCYHKKFL